MMFLDDSLCPEGSQLLNVFTLVRTVIKILQIAIPMGLILMGTVDMGKAVIAGDEKKIKEAQKPFVKRIIAAVIVFIIPFIVNLIMNLVTTNNDEWKACWNAANGKFEAFDASGELE